LGKIATEAATEAATATAAAIALTASEFALIYGTSIIAIKSGSIVTRVCIFIFIFLGKFRNYRKRFSDFFPFIFRHCLAL